jgi:hypothetical protein
VLADQAALYGVLAEIEALSLELIEVRRLPSRPPEERSSSGRSAPGPSTEEHGWPAGRLRGTH